MSSGKQERISLYYRDGRSDKVYHAQIEESGDGFVVNYQFGRRGSTLQAGTKTESPVTHEKAKKIFDKLVSEKKAKEYQEGESGTSYQTPREPSKKSDLSPQLLNPIDADAASLLLQDDNWLLQEKKDGRRLLLRNTANHAEGVNRKGCFVAIPKPVEEALQEIGGDFVLDGESIGDVYWAFDLLEFDGVNLREWSFIRRYQKLLGLLQDLGVDSPLQLVPAVADFAAKVALVERLRRERAEGLVFKQAGAKYVPGRPNSGGTQLKHKFTARITCSVLGQNAKKRSVHLAVLQEPGGKEVEIGKVTIPPNHRVPVTGSLVDVEYLYAYPGGSLYQPVYRGERDDLEHADSVAFLKFKQDDDEEEAKTD